MHSTFFQAICRTGIFMICAQAIVQFRPQESYEKYLKLLVSVMVLIQLFSPIAGLLSGDGGSTAADRLDALRQSLEKSMEEARQQAEKTDALLERMTLEEVRRRAEEQRAAEQSTEESSAEAQRAEEPPVEEGSAEAQRTEEQRAAEQSTEEGSAEAQRAEEQEAEESSAWAQRTEEQEAEESSAGAQRAEEPSGEGTAAGGHDIRVEVAPVEPILGGQAAAP